MGWNGHDHLEEHESNSAERGMDLRDYFAAKAMHAEIVTTFSDATPEAAELFTKAAAGCGHTPEQHLAFNAHKIADAMLEARKK